MICMYKPVGYIPVTMILSVQPWSCDPNGFIAPHLRSCGGWERRVTNGEGETAVAWSFMLQH